jgi:hypothetical protein
VRSQEFVGQASYLHEPAIEHLAYLGSDPVTQAGLRSSQTPSFIPDSPLSTPHSPFPIPHSPTQTGKVGNTPLICFLYGTSAFP